MNLQHTPEPRDFPQKLNRPRWNLKGNALVSKGWMCTVHPLRVSLLLAGMVGCGSVTVDPIQVHGPCPGLPIRGPSDYAATAPPDALITDFETGRIDLYKAVGRDGSWIFGKDTSVLGNVIYKADNACAARGQYAGHFAASGFNTWANWTAVFRAQPMGDAGISVPLPYDGRAYSGISFWAASVSDADAGAATIPVGITTMDTAWNSLDCTVCSDNYMTEVSLTSDWRRFVVSFDAVKQAGFGKPQTPLDRSQLVGFMLAPTPPFDMWIDDVRFEGL